MRRILVSACLIGACCRYDGADNTNEAVCSLLERQDICLVPVCPEQLGGLTTPRTPYERLGGLVMSKAGEDVTPAFARGAAQALKIAERFGCYAAILKERSPSCGSGQIYDGSFSGALTEGDGVTAQVLKRHGIRVYGESQVSQLLETL